MTQREISKTPPCPSLSSKAIELLNILCFRKNDKEILPVDLLFVFGTAVSFSELAKSLDGLFQKKIAKKMVITGGMEKYSDSWSHDLPEAEMIFNAIKDQIPKDMKVILEKKSQNTLENIQFALPLLQNTFSSLCFVTKNFHAGRSYLTLRKFFPDIKIFQHTFDPLYRSVEGIIRKEDWHKEPEFAKRIWGEYLRIKSYGERGDLPLQEVRDILLEIEKETS